MGGPMLCKEKPGINTLACYLAHGSLSLRERVPILGNDLVQS